MKFTLARWFMVKVKFKWFIGKIETKTRKASGLSMSQVGAL